MYTLWDAATRKWLDREDMDLEIAVGDIVEGTVTGITKFGAFVELPGNKVGLVHISEVSHDYVKEVRDFLNEQDTVKVKVLKMDGEGKLVFPLKRHCHRSQNRNQLFPCLLKI